MVAKKTNGSAPKPEAFHPAVHPLAKQVSSAGKSPLTSQQMAALKSLGVEYSEDVDARNLKILFWGATSTRKTETVLRNFPNVLLIDAEGNSDQCVKNRAIPPFQRIKTQDTRKVLEILDAASKGLLCMPNGQPVLTVCIDSVSVIWSIQQEVAGSLAEQKARKYNRPLDEASPTMQDWNKAKRPLKQVLNRFSKTPIPFLVLIAREKPLYEELPGGELKKIGVTANMVRDTEYDMNLALHFYTDNNVWGYEVTKVQGALGEIFPIGTRGKKLPMEELLEYSKQLKPDRPEPEVDGEDLAGEIAGDIIRETVERTQSNLIKYATEKGYDAKALGMILKGAGFSGFDPSRWDEMIRAIDEAAAADGSISVD